jgi:bifunctional non-homologous end joining protein LigD
MHWARPELVAEIEFAGWTDDGNVRQAAFKGLRDDKPPREIGLETPARVGDANVTASTRPKARKAKAGEAPAGARSPSAVKGVAISHPDKPLWRATTRRWATG